MYSKLVIASNENGKQGNLSGDVGKMGMRMAYIGPE